MPSAETPIGNSIASRHFLPAWLRHAPVFSFFSRARVLSLVGGILLGALGAALPSPAQAVGCGTTYRVKRFGGGNYTTIQAAVDAVPNSYSGSYCINVDSHPYIEHVTIVNKTGGVNDRIAIQSDPTMVSTATPVYPPALSTAAFYILNASVTIAGFNIISTNTLPYGVLVSSQFVKLSSVNVIDPGGNIYVAGIQLSSWNTVGYSSVTVGGANAYGFYLPGSTATTVSYSTATSPLSALWLDHASFNSVDHGTFSCTGTGNGLHLSGASSNTFTSVYGYAAGNHAAFIENDSSTNTFTNVTLTCNDSGAGLYLKDSSSNTLSWCVIFTLDDFYAAEINGSDTRGTTISHSTITKPSADTSEALWISQSYVSVTDSYISAWSPFRAIGTNHLTVSRSTITSTGDTQPAMDFNVSYSTIDNCYIEAANGHGIASNGSNNIIVNSTVVVGGASYAVQLQDAALNTFTSSLFISSGSGGYAAYLVGNASSNTFTWDFFTSIGQAMYVRDQSNMNVIARSTMTSSTLRGISFNNVSSNTLTDCYLQGSTAVYVVNSTGTVIGNSTLFAFQQGNSALWALYGNVNLTVTSSTLLAPLYPGTTSSVLLIDRPSRGLLVLSTNTISGGQYGIRVGTQTSATQLWITSNTVVLSTSNARNDYGIYLDGLASGATIQNNAIVLRKSGDVSPYGVYGLYTRSSAQINFDHNRISNPGLLTGGSFNGSRR